jgi:CheY-like chemotaxis protein
LIIDDEERVRQACRRVLEPEGYTVSEAAHGRQGLVMIQKDKPDLVLVDLMMPVMDGTEVLGALRRDHPDLAVVVITGYATMDRAVEAMKLGADDFLAKPFRPQDLRLVVDRALRRVRTLEDLATEKSRYRVLVQALTNGVLVVDATGRVALANPALRRLLECGGDCHQRPAEEVLPCPQVVETLRQVLAEPQTEPVTAACSITPAGEDEPRTMQVNCAPFLDGRGHLMGAVAVFDDVSAHLRVAEIQTRARTYLEAVINHLNLGIIVLDADFRTTFFNDDQAALFRRLGVEASLIEIIGSPIEATYPILTRDEWDGIRSRVLRAGETVTWAKLGYPRLAPASYFLVTVVPLAAPGDDRAGAVCVTEDTTKTVALERELVKKERLALIGQMTIALNHEINNPLTAILGTAESLTFGKSLSPEVSARVEAIRTNALRIVDVTRKLRQIEDVHLTEYIQGGPLMLDIHAHAK